MDLAKIFSHRHYDPQGKSPSSNLSYADAINKASQDDNYEINSKLFDLNDNLIVCLKISNEKGTENFQCKFLCDKSSFHDYSTCEIIPLSVKGEQNGPEQTVSLEKYPRLREIMNIDDDDGGSCVKLPNSYDDPTISPKTLLHLPA
jgi:hypothetical protein